MTIENENPCDVRLPTSHVLSYLTTTGSPTRVRRVASMGMWVVGGVSFLIAAPFLFVACALVYDLATGHRVALTSLGIGDYLEAYKFLFSRFLYDLGMGDIVRYIIEHLDWDGWLSSGSLLFWTLNGAGLIFFAKGVKRGDRASCRICALALAMAIIWVAGVSVIIGGLSFTFGLNIGGAPQPLDFLWLLSYLILAPAILALFDLYRFLRWITRYPIDEKPQVAFLPGNAS